MFTFGFFEVLPAQPKMPPIAPSTGYVVACFMFFVFENCCMYLHLSCSVLLCMAFVLKIFLHAFCLMQAWSFNVRLL